ncbi:MAG: phosphoribosylformylglycinamidine cyclo-ligase [Methanomicrobiales archaeon]|nr:phosphoribosylformylglycinamidine cyclo-ligase [Methanomicrobiales archaeon]
MSRHTYRSAGVDIDLEKRAIEALVKRLTFRRQGPYPMKGEIGHFSGLIEYGTQVLALTTDGVGTKILIADQLQDWRTIGIDCIAMNVNDLYVMNVEPVAFVDYIAADTITEEVLEQIGVGLNEGARQANINVVGGETATLKGIIKGLDLAGTCLGIQKKDRVVTGEGIRPGDQIVGIPSSGIHSNGLTLARQIVEDSGGYGKNLEGGSTLGEELLRPTRIYHESLKVCAACTVHGMAHITGGGLLNFLRLTSYGFDFTDPLPVPAIFRYLQGQGNVSREEMYRTFNMGMGYAFVVPEDQVHAVQKFLPDARVVGECVKMPGVRIEGEPVRYR